MQERISIEGDAYNILCPVPVQIVQTRAQKAFSTAADDMLRKAGTTVHVFPNGNIEVATIFAGNDIDLAVEVDIRDIHRVQTALIGGDRPANPGATRKNSRLSKPEEGITGGAQIRLSHNDIQSTVVIDIGSRNPVSGNAGRDTHIVTDPAAGASTGILPPGHGCACGPHRTNDVELPIAIDIGYGDAGAHDIRRDQNGWPVSLTRIGRNLEIVGTGAAGENDLRQTTRDNLSQRIAPAFESRRIRREGSDENRAPVRPLSVVFEPVNAELRTTTDRPFSNDVRPLVIIDIDDEHAVHSRRQCETRPVSAQITAGITIPIRTRDNISEAVTIDIPEIQSRSRRRTGCIDLDIMPGVQR